MMTEGRVKLSDLTEEEREQAANSLVALREEEASECESACDLESVGGLYRQPDGYIFVDL